MAYVKLFSTILDSTLWEESVHVRMVWITMLVMADEYGEVGASVPGLAKRAGVDRAHVEQALSSFLAPDPDSRSKENEGRRIEEIDGGWRLLNHDKYRRRRTAEEDRERNAEKQRRWRERNQKVTARLEVTEVTAVDQNTPIRSEQIRSDQITEREREPAAPATPPAVVSKPKRTKGASVPGTRIPDDYTAPASVIEWAHKKLGVDPMPSVDKFVDHWKSSRLPNSVKADWDAALRNWVRTDAEAGKLPAWEPPPEPKPESTEPKIPMPAEVGAELMSLFAQTEQDQLPDCRREVSK